MGGLNLRSRNPYEFYGEVSIFDTKTKTCKKVVDGEDIENPRDNGRTAEKCAFGRSGVATVNSVNPAISPRYGHGDTPDVGWEQRLLPTHGGVRCSSSTARLATHRCDAVLQD